MERGDSLGLTEEEYAEVRSAFRPGRYTGELLLSLAREKANFDQAPIESREGAARSLFIAATHLLADCLGEYALSTLYGKDPTDDAPTSEHLTTLASRLFSLSHVFVNYDRTAKSSLDAACDELRAIAGGDTPRLFAAQKGKQGLNNNHYRLAQHKLRALVWERFLQAQGNSAGDAQNAVASAFGAPWGTIYRWREPVAKYLGQDRIEKAMRDAERGLSSEIGVVRSADQAIQRMAEHGAAFRAENAKRLKAAD